ncbi:MAG: exodeoxyribonuclease VII large subunit [Phycisphaerae bacterium]
MAGKAFDFFNPDRAKGPRKGPDVGKDVTSEFTDPKGDSAQSGRKPITVSVLIGQIKAALADGLPERMAIVGEISNFKRHTSGHMYFRLKDADSAIDAAMFRFAASKLKFRPENGLEVIVQGRVDVYDVRGQLQLYVEQMTPKGAGVLELAFRQLREKLEKEGLFDPSLKKPIPRFPKTIGVITSPTGAAIRDIRRTIKRRWPGVQVYLHPALVQGPGSAEQIAEAIRLTDLNAGRLGIETLIIGRGGGSLEDLWAFNEEVVARAIHRARVPIISGVGHEVDVTISDLVADVRAATPTAAAEIAVPNRADVAAAVRSLDDRLTRRVRAILDMCAAQVDGIARSVVFRDPAHRLRSAQQRLDENAQRLVSAVRENVSRHRQRLGEPAGRLAALHPARLHDRAVGRLRDLAYRLRWALGGRSKQAGDRLSALSARLGAVHPGGRLKLEKQKLASLHRQLEAMSYRNVLKRGYSVTRDADGKILRSAHASAAGDPLETELVDGKIRSVVSGDKAPLPVKPRKTSKKKPPTPDEDHPTLF